MVQGEGCLPRLNSGFVIFRKVLNLSAPQFSHLYNGCNTNSYAIGNYEDSISYYLYTHGTVSTQ